MNFFGTVSDYPSMLNKISTYTFVVACLLIYIIREQITVIDTTLQPYNLSIPIASGLLIPLGTLLPAFIITLMSRIFKLHDRVSDLFSIRKNFDVQHILYLMVLNTSPNLSMEQVKKIPEKRNDLMQKTFYKYASSTKGKSVIDEHYITLALDQWAWYWIIIESTILITITGIIFGATNNYLASIISLLLVLSITLFILPRILQQCAKYASDEVEQILADKKRSEEIAKVFRAI